MPRVVRSTRNNAKKEQDEKVKDKVITTNIEPSSTNSTRDPSVDNYKLHFELTDLESTKSNTTPHNDGGDIQGVLKHGQGGGVGKHSELGSTVGKVEADLRVGEERDGSGEPDHTSNNIDHTRQIQIQHDRFVPRSTSPNNNKFPIDPNLTYIPQYLHESDSKSCSTCFHRA